MCAASNCGFVHHAPVFARALHVSCARYNDWLAKQAESCRERDRGWPQRPGTAEYKRVIHKQVVRSNGLDFYTGRPIRWDLLNHERLPATGRRAHRRRGRYPSVDHYVGPGKLDYRICTGAVNGAKGALTHQHFVELCLEVARHAGLAP